jgi:hypothetical protein
VSRFTVVLDLETEPLEIEPTKKAVEEFVKEMLEAASVDGDQVSLNYVSYGDDE